VLVIAGGWSRGLRDSLGIFCIHSMTAGFVHRGGFPRSLALSDLVTASADLKYHRCVCGSDATMDN
jgi:hypothetical protein